MILYQMLSPANGGATRMPSGRVYSASAGAVLNNVPDFDADILAANGWIKSAASGAGSSAARPIKAKVGAAFHDTTLGKIIYFDGKAWRDPLTGAIV